MTMIVERSNRRTRSLGKKRGGEGVEVEVEVEVGNIEDIERYKY